MKNILIIFITLILTGCSDTEHERFIYNIIYRVDIFSTTNSNVNISYKDADGNTQNLTSPTVTVEVEINKEYSDGVFHPYLQATRNLLPSESLVVTIILEDYKTSFSTVILNSIIQTNNSGAAADITATVYGPILPL